MKISVLFFAIVLSLTGCAVQKELQPTGGSRADGTIKMSYEVGEFEQPVVDMAQAQASAKARCKKWGYKDAEPFGGQQTTCNQPGGFNGCANRLVTVEFQCLGNLK